MSFLSRVTKIVEDGLAGIATALEDDNEFRKDWTKARKEIRAAWREAGAGIRESGWDVTAASRPENGSDRLVIEAEGTEYSFWLRFSPDQAGRRIECSASESLGDRFPRDFYGLDALTREAIENLITTFIEAVLDYLAMDGRRLPLPRL